MCFPQRSIIRTAIHIVRSRADGQFRTEFKIDGFVQAQLEVPLLPGAMNQHGESPHDEVEPCDRKVRKEYKTEKPKGEGERRDDICSGAF